MGYRPGRGCILYEHIPEGFLQTPLHCEKDRHQGGHIAEIWTALFHTHFGGQKGLFIELAGNYQITQDAFDDFLEQENITVGLKKSELDIEELEKEIRRAFPQVTWTCAMLSGTRLRIEIKENDVPMPEEQAQQGCTDLVAEFEGTVVSMIVRSGVPQVAIGDTVEPGTILVAGMVPIYNDDKTVKGYLPVTSDADIMVEHIRTEEFTLPFEYVKKEYTGRTEVRHFLRGWEKEWRLPQERPFLVYDSVIRENRPLLFEKLSIPVYWGDYTYREYLDVEYRYSPEEAQELLNEKLNTFLTSLEEKGVQILEKDVRIDTSGEEWLMYGEFLVQEPAGRSVSAEIPDTGENEVNE